MLTYQPKPQSLLRICQMELQSESQALLQEKKYIFQYLSLEDRTHCNRFVIIFQAVNPGSAGKGRFGRPASVRKAAPKALLHTEGRSQQSGPVILVFTQPAF